MAYCTASDVASVNRKLILGAGNNPTASDVTGYVNMIAGEIDATLTTRGVQVPVAVASFPEAGAFLQALNVKGAVWMCEAAIGTNPAAIDKAKAAYDAALKLLSDAKFTMDVPSELARAEVRAPFITFQPQPGVFDPTLSEIGGHAGDGISQGVRNDRSKPFFSRSMRF